jgi:hypothetical protein
MNEGVKKALMKGPIVFGRGSHGIPRRERGGAKTGVCISINDGIAEIGIDSPTRIVGQILFCFSSRMGYYSADGLKSMIETAADTAAEYLTLKRSVLLHRQIMGMRHFIKTHDDKDELLKFIFEQILIAECLPTLPGFGYVAMEKNEEGRRRIKGNFMINPEKTSIYSIA